MNLPPDYHPEFGSIIDALVEVAHIGSVDALLRRMMAGLEERPHVAAARLWLIDQCDQHKLCVLQPECAKRDTGTSFP
jgi:hypothetical protein